MAKRKKANSEVLPITPGEAKLMTKTYDRNEAIYDQYQTIKDEYSEPLVLLRLGDFYEAFGRDAGVLAEALDLLIVTFPLGQRRGVPMAGFPAGAAEPMVEKLLAAGHRVALADPVRPEQVEAIRNCRCVVTKRSRK